MFHLFTVEKETYATLQSIFAIPEIKQNFALAGGTSLALQIGHRTSIDLDIFSPDNIDTKQLEIVLSSHGMHFEFINSSRVMLFSFINGIKCDFVHEPSMLLQPFIKHQGVNYFHVEDIAAMKMHTICGRGKKKDFFDIYALIENFGWEKMLDWFGKKYGTSQYYFLWRSINYFEEADEDADIIGIPPYSKTWQQIKQFLRETCG